MGNKYHIQPGDRFNRLTCIDLDHIGKHHRSYFLFKCDCGKKKVILGSGVVSGNTKSCGCLSLEVKKAKRLPSNHGEVTAIILGYKRHAKTRKYDWLLSREDVNDIILKNCHYCNSTPKNIKTTKNSIEGLLYSGIDRVDNDRGYESDNCVPCCKQCNRAKGEMSKNEFIIWIKAMAEQWSK